MNNTIRLGFLSLGLKECLTSSEMDEIFGKDFDGDRFVKDFQTILESFVGADDKMIEAMTEVVREEFKEYYNA